MHNKANLNGTQPPLTAAVVFTHFISGFHVPHRPNISWRAIIGDDDAGKTAVVYQSHTVDTQMVRWERITTDVIQKWKKAAITQDLAPGCGAENRLIRSWEGKQTQLGFRAASVEAGSPSLLPIQITPYQVFLLTLGRLQCPGGRAPRLL